jgi:hypothetical protein
MRGTTVKIIVTLPMYQYAQGEIPQDRDYHQYWREKLRFADRK